MGDMAAIALDGGDSGQPNHPLAVRMAVIAFLNMNITIGCLFGAYSVLVTAVEQRLGIGRELSMLGIPAVNLATAICAPLTGFLASRLPLRTIMVAGAAMGFAGYLLLAVADSLPLFVIAYGLLIGPAMASVGVIMPPTLVTRWFSSNRGRAIGIVTAPVVIGMVPLSITWILAQHGLIVCYLVLAALSAIPLVANFFVLDRPPGSSAPAAKDASSGQPAAAGAGMALFLGSAAFWALVVANMGSITSSVVVSAHMVPMMESWGHSAALAASLLTVQMVSGAVGGFSLGWLADRIGGAMTFALMSLVCMAMWLAFLALPPVPALFGIVSLIGLMGGGAVPVFSLALSDVFGRENFSRAYGLANLVNLPVSVACVPVAGLLYARSGSYASAILVVAAMLAFALVILALVRPRRAAA
jgi:MFS family permease